MIIQRLTKQLCILHLMRPVLPAFNAPGSLLVVLGAVRLHRIAKLPGKKAKRNAASSMVWAFSGVAWEFCVGELWAPMDQDTCFSKVQLVCENGTCIPVSGAGQGGWNWLIRLHVGTVHTASFESRFLFHMSLPVPVRPLLTGCVTPDGCDSARLLFDTGSDNVAWNKTVQQPDWLSALQCLPLARRSLSQRCD